MGLDGRLGFNIWGEAPVSRQAGNCSIGFRMSGLLKSFGCLLLGIASEALGSQAYEQARAPKVPRFGFEAYASVLSAQPLNISEKRTSHRKETQLARSQGRSCKAHSLMIPPTGRIVLAPIGKRQV